MNWYLLLQILVCIFAAIGLFFTIALIYFAAKGELKDKSDEQPKELTDAEFEKLKEEFRLISAERPGTFWNGISAYVLSIGSILLIVGVIGITIYWYILKGCEKAEYYPLLLLSNVIPLTLLYYVLKMLKRRNAYIRKSGRFFDKLELKRK